jgi:hypothetical protein
MDKFKRDLNTGLKFEMKLLDHIKHIGYEKPDGYFPYYDFKIFKSNGHTSTYEVKADMLILKTGNIAIEYMCRGKLSGISLSTAKYWAIFAYTGNKYTLYKIPSKALKKLIDKKKYKKNICGGDDGVSKMYLFDKTLFEEYIIYSNL